MFPTTLHVKARETRSVAADKNVARTPRFARPGSPTVATETRAYRATPLHPSAFHNAPGRDPGHTTHGQPRAGRRRFHARRCPGNTAYLSERHPAQTVCRTDAVLNRA